MVRTSYCNETDHFFPQKPLMRKPNATTDPAARNRDIKEPTTNLWSLSGWKHFALSFAIKPWL